MVPRRWLFFLYLCCVALIAPVAAQSGLRLEPGGGEPSGIFWDGDGLAGRNGLMGDKARSPLPLSLKVTNQSDLPCRVQLQWQVTDSNGLVCLRKSGDYDCTPRGTLQIRDDFNAPGRGAYLLSAQARRQGSEVWSRVMWPFALTATPTPQFRPQSFFALDAPLLLTGTNLDFYARCGARVLRSDVLDGNVPRGVLDEQLRARLSRNLATLAVLDDAGGRSENMTWTSRAMPVLTRYSAVKTWEMTAAPAVRTADFSLTARTARPDASWVCPLTDSVGVTGTKAAPNGQVAGLSVVMTPLCVQVPGEQATPANIPGGVAHPHALLRALRDAATKAQSSKAALHVRAQLPPATTPVAAAGALVTRYTLAIMAGASGLSVPLDAEKTAASMQSCYAQAAAFAQMSSLLEDAAFEGDIFPNSPALCGALFKAPQGTIALVWPSREGPVATLKTRLPGARLLDVFGNPLPGGQWNGNLNIPLGAAPVYVISAASPSQVALALRGAQVEGIAPVAVRAMPLTQIVTDGVPAKIGVRLQNVLLQKQTGTLRLSPPPGWTMVHSAQNFVLWPGEIRDYFFEAASAATSRDGSYPVTVALDVPGGSGAWKQALRVACAENVQNGRALRLDGNLRDWNSAQWMEIEAKADGAGARVALLWDSNYLYVAAQVDEPRLRPAAGNDFQDGDALQVAFGTRGDGAPQSVPFRDTDWSLILSAQAGGRVILPGVILPTDARCITRRDEKRNRTFYEACVPLSALPDLKPASRASHETPVRFGWILHNDEGAPLEWGAAVSVFQWWRNPSSFAPDSRLFLAAQMPLGFAQEGAINTRPPSFSSNSSSGSSTRAPSAPRRQPREEDKDDTETEAPDGGILAPMSPRLLPPAKPPAGRPLLPQSPATLSKLPG